MAISWGQGLDIEMRNIGQLQRETRPSVLDISQCVKLGSHNEENVRFFIHKLLDFGLSLIGLKVLISH